MLFLEFFSEVESADTGVSQPLKQHNESYISSWNLKSCRIVKNLSQLLWRPELRSKMSSEWRNRSEVKCFDRLWSGLVAHRPRMTVSLIFRQIHSNQEVCLSAVFQQKIEHDTISGWWPSSGSQRRWRLMFPDLSNSSRSLYHEYLSPDLLIAV